MQWFINEPEKLVRGIGMRTHTENKSEKINPRRYIPGDLCLAWQVRPQARSPREPLLILHVTVVPGFT